MPTNFRPKINSISATTTEGTGSITTTLSASLTYPVGASISYDWRIGSQTFVSTSPSVTIDGATHGYGYYNVCLKVQFTGSDGYNYWDLKIEPGMLKVNNASASTYYFDNSGTTGAGTEANPWGRFSELNTWQTGGAVDGDTLKVLNGSGVYSMDADFNIYHVLHIETYGTGDRPTWDGDASRRFFSRDGLIKVSFDGVNLQNFNTSTFSEVIPQLRNVHIEDVGRAFHWGDGNRLNPTVGLRSGAAGHAVSIPNGSRDAFAVDTTVTNAHNCVVYGFGGDQIYINIDADQGHDKIATYMGWSVDEMRSNGPGEGLNDGFCMHDNSGSFVHIEGGSIENCCEQCIDFNCKGGWEWIKTENLIIDFAYDTPILTGNLTNYIFEKNIIRNARQAGEFRGSKMFFENNLQFCTPPLKWSFFGIRLRPNSHNSGIAGIQNFIRFNTFVCETTSDKTNMRGIYIESPTSGEHTDIHVVGNIFYCIGSGSVGNFIEGASSSFDPQDLSHKFEDNVYYSANGYSNIARDGGRNTNYSTLASWNTATGHDGGSITSNPLLTGGTYQTASDFELQSTSPARSLAFSNYMVYSDYNGVLYSDSNNDSGAISYYTGSTDVTKLIPEVFSLVFSVRSAAVTPPVRPSKRKEVRNILFGVKRFRRQ